MIGQKDTTAIGKDLASPEARKTLGNYPELGQQAHARIKGSVLVKFDDLGHAPQVQDAERFNTSLLDQLGKLP
jgi:pimeloyl-ACP methyl ester carboxylesterase